MGRARIVGNYGDGEYRVEIVKDTSMLSRTLESMSYAISQMQDQQSQAQSNKSQLQSQLATLQSQAQEYTNQLATINSELTMLQANIPDPEDYAYTVDYEEAVEQWEADLDYWYQQREAVTSVYAQISGQAAEMELQLSLAEQTLGRIDVTLSAMQDRLSRMQDATSSTDTRTVWCADYSDELSGEVETIEINGESEEILIAPYQREMQEPKGGVLVDFDMMSAAGALYNWVAMPAWQLHKPTFRVGTIISIDKMAGTADVRLPVVRSSALSSLNINKAQDLLGCHIAYMDCNPTPFEEGDEVVVQFRDQVWEMGTVIGYAKEPQQCDDCRCEPKSVAERIINLEGDFDWDLQGLYENAVFEKACEDKAFWRVVDENNRVWFIGDMVASDPEKPEESIMVNLPSVEEADPVEEADEVELNDDAREGLTDADYYDGGPDVEDGTFEIGEESGGPINLAEAWKDLRRREHAGGVWRLENLSQGYTAASGPIGANGALLGLPTSYQNEDAYVSVYQLTASSFGDAVSEYEDWARDYYDEDSPCHPDHQYYEGPDLAGDHCGAAYDGLGSEDPADPDEGEEEEKEEERVFYLEIGCYDEEKGDMVWPRD